MRVFPWLAAALPVATLLANLLHEAGHVAAGAVAGFRWARLRAGPLVMRRENGSLRLAFDRRHLFTFDGASRMMTRPGGLTRARVAWLITGGPAASLVTAGAACLWRLWWPPANPFAHALVFDLALISLAAGVLSLTPWNAGGILTDGFLLRELVASRQRAGRVLAWMHVSTQWATGERPSQWDGALLAEVCALEDSSPLEARVRQMAYYRALDLRRIEEARAHLERAWALRYGLPPQGIAALHHDRALFLALYGNDATEARRCLERARRPWRGATPVSARIAEAAVLLAEARPDEARRLARDAREELRSMRQTPLVQAELAWVEETLLGAGRY